MFCPQLADQINHINPTAAAPATNPCGGGFRPALPVASGRRLAGNVKKLFVMSGISVAADGRTDRVGVGTGVGSAGTGAVGLLDG